MDGYLLLHGKKSGPSYYDCSLIPLADQLSQHSLVDFESHAWAYDRLYDQPFETCVDSIKQAKQRLVDRGATQIHIVGHSLGGNASIYYASKFLDFSSLILLAPAHNTHIAKIRAQCAWSIRKAKELLENNNDERSHFVDFDAADTTISYVKPSIYISYFDADGPCNMTSNARKIAQPISVLCISGERDITQTTTKELIYDPLLKTQHSKFYRVDEDHHTVCHTAHETIVNWIKTLS